MTKTIAVDNRSLPLIIRRTSRKRSIGVELTCRHEVVVRAPRALGEKAIREGVDKCLPWLRKKLLLLPPAALSSLSSGGELLVLGEARKLVVERGEGAESRVVACDGEVRVILPGSREMAPAAVRSAMVGWYQTQATEVIGELVARYSSVIGVSPPPFSITHARRRWGSCGANGRLNFAWRLAMAPLVCIEYVVVHELCHLKRRDHSPAFWAMVAEILPDYRERRRLLQQQGIRYDL